MKKRNLATLALMGITMGLLTTSFTANDQQTFSPEEKTFYDMLDENGKKEFSELDTKHRKMALSTIEQSCKAEHECKGIRESAVHEQYVDQKQNS